MTQLDRTIYADTPEEAARVREMLYAYDDSQWQAGSAEPWIAELLAALVRACDARVAIEIGGFQGYTSKYIAAALSRLPHATDFTVCEIDLRRAQDVQDVLDMGYGFRLRTRVVCDDSHRWIPTLADSSVDFVWVDGCHEKAHVQREIELLWPKMSPTGIIALHDVWGVCDLQTIVRAAGGIALDLPRLGPAGGVGLIQPGRA